MKSADGRFEYCDKDGDPLPDTQAFSGTSKVGHFNYRCRRHNGEWCGINIVNAGRKLPKRSWVLSGTQSHPTIAPSINCGACGWHGFIEGGIYLNVHKQPEPQQ